jgi:hypothetical protein
VDAVLRYPLALDSRRYDDLLTVFTDDAVGWFGADPLEGATAITAWIVAQTGGVRYSHHQLTVGTVELDATGNEATVMSWATMALTFEDGRPTNILLGRYHDRLRRVDGTWRIAEKRLDVGWRGTFEP